MSEYVTFKPQLDGPFERRFLEQVGNIGRLTREELDELVTKEVQWATDVVLNPRQRRIYRAAWLVLRDLLRAGWVTRWMGNNLEVAPPSGFVGRAPADLAAAKAFLRSAMSDARREKIAESREFIRAMENPSVNGLARVPIKDLVADGEALAAELRAISELPDSERTVALRSVVKPYLQLVRDNERCPHSGHKLADIWRYFRFTWATPSENTPGRTMLYLVRDAARPYHPVMGLISLENAPLRIASRDKMLGWLPESLEETLQQATSEVEVRRAIERLLTHIDYALSGIDLTGLCSSEELHKPTEEVISRLVSIAARSTAEREEALRRWRRPVTDEDDQEVIAEKSSLGNISVDAENALFRRKRAESLGRLLSAKRILLSFLARPNARENWKPFIQGEEGQSAVRTALIGLKNRFVGTSIMELNVCGAIPPYNELLGGKLAALLTLSPEVVADYRTRYGNRASDIASRLKGQPVVRPADLVYIGTTSLYSVGSSQYNRLKLPQGLLQSSAPEVRWQQLGVTKGYGSLHISRVTLQCLEELSDSDDFQHVNHVFGEGSSPKMRIMRRGLDVLFGAGYRATAEAVSRHAMPRLVYGAFLAANGAAYLQGETTEPEYYFDSEMDPKEATERIAEFWRQRWLLPRLSFGPCLDRVSSFERDSINVSSGLSDSKAIEFVPIREEVPALPAVPAMDDNRVLEFIRELYRGKSGYADNTSSDLLSAMHVTTRIDEQIMTAVAAGKSVILTGYPGDGKTHLLRMLLLRLEQMESHPVVELDASTLTDNELFEKWRRASDEGRPFCVAINEAVLLNLARCHPEFSPAVEAQQQVEEGLAYEEMPLVLDSNVVTFDLSRRNVLAADVVTSALEKLLNPTTQKSCQLCPGAGQCDYIRHRRLLSKTRVRERLQAVLDRVTRRGYHATLRELQSLLSFLLLGDRDCAGLLKTSGDLDYSLPELLYRGKGKLFDQIRSTFDPARMTHPVFDAQLVEGALSHDEWLEDTALAPVHPDDPDRVNAAKRAFFLFHEKGDQLLLIGGDLEAQFQSFLESSAKEQLRFLLWHVEAFFGGDGSGDILHAWQSHTFGQADSSVLFAVRAYPRRDFRVLRPRLSTSMSQAFDLALDHVLLTHVDKRNARLVVDFGVYRALVLAEQGVPLRALDEDVVRRLRRFVEQLSGSPTSEELDEVVIEVLDSVSGEHLSVAVDVMGRRYLSIAQKGEN